MAIHGGDVYNNKIEMDYSVNLNPYGVDDRIKEAVKNSLNAINIYPDIDECKVRNALSRLDNISDDMVIATSGASEAIMAVTRAINPREAVLIEPCFYGYRHCLNGLSDCHITEVKTSIDNGFATYEMVLDRLTDKTDILYIADPVNPIGNNISDNFLRQLLQRTSELNISVVLDESFIYMSSKALEKRLTVDEILNINRNTFIIRSFTKLFSVPGIRAGFVISNRSNIAKVKMQLPEWNISVMAEAVLTKGADIIAGTDYIEKTVKYINGERLYLENELKKCQIEVYQSDTAYILIKTNKDLYNQLLNEGILIRDCSNYIGLEKGYYRIAVKSKADNIKFIQRIHK